MSVTDDKNGTGSSSGAAAGAADRNVKPALPSVEEELQNDPAPPQPNDVLVYYSDHQNHNHQHQKHQKCRQSVVEDHAGNVFYRQLLKKYSEYSSSNNNNNSSTKKDDSNRETEKHRSHEWNGQVGNRNDDGSVASSRLRRAATRVVDIVCRDRGGRFLLLSAEGFHRNKKMTVLNRGDAVDKVSQDLMRFQSTGRSVLEDSPTTKEPVTSKIRTETANSTSTATAPQSGGFVIPRKKRKRSPDTDTSKNASDGRQSPAVANISLDSRPDMAAPTTTAAAAAAVHRERHDFLICYRAIADPKRDNVHPYALELIAAVCNEFVKQRKQQHRIRFDVAERQKLYIDAVTTVFDVPQKQSSCTDQEDGVDGNISRKKQKEETARERLMRLQLRHRFLSAAATSGPPSTSPVEFAQSLLQIWGASLVKVGCKTPKQQQQHHCSSRISSVTKAATPCYGSNKFGAGSASVTAESTTCHPPSVLLSLDQVKSQNSCHSENEGSEDSENCEPTASQGELLVSDSNKRVGFQHGEEQRGFYMPRRKSTIDDPESWCNSTDNRGVGDSDVKRAISYRKRRETTGSKTTVQANGGRGLQVAGVEVGDTGPHSREKHDGSCGTSKSSLLDRAHDSGDDYAIQQGPCRDYFPGSRKRLRTSSHPIPRIINKTDCNPLDERGKSLSYQDTSSSLLRGFASEQNKDPNLKVKPNGHAAMSLSGETGHHEKIIRRGEQEDLLSGPWNDYEKIVFCHGLEQFGVGKWSRIKEMIPTRRYGSVRSFGGYLKSKFKMQNGQQHLSKEAVKYLFPKGPPSALHIQHS